MTTAVYMDHNATTPVRPEAAQAVRDVLCSVGNPSSVHGPGREARRCLEAAREAVAHLVGAAPADLVLTGGGTEANDLAINGAARPRVLVSAVEHDSVGRARPDAEQIPVDGDGRVDPDQVARMLAADGRPALVSVMLANNETGVLQPVARIAEVARAAGALVHCDAIQAVGKVPVNLHDLGVDLLTV
ncbi:MAG: aminotransferase class V-fold PLP-dependent enzyme, partial [Rhodobacterales bacterium]|nr:aminotransferase class V-fold PLP-dependent enzyme [Rhodobacterales bacterium]